MKFMLLLLVFGYIALANSVPSSILHPGGIGGIFKGPNSETIIKGPDGSIITSAAEGGEVHSELQPIIVEEPVVVEEVVPVAVPAPVVAPVAIATPAVTPLEVVPPVAHPIETVIVPAPAVESKQSSDLIGPSGRITTHGSQSVVAGPSSTTVTGPAIVAETVIKGPPIIAAAPVIHQVAAVTASPIATVTGTPLSVSAAPLAPELSLSHVSAAPLAELSPVSITPAPIVTATGAEIELSSLGGVPVSTAAPYAPIPAGLSHISVTTSSLGSHGTLVGGPLRHNIARADIGIPAVTPSPLPLLPSTISPISVTGPIQGVGNHGLLRLNDQADLRGVPLVPDQLAIDNRQLLINPALIPSNNIIPPEIGVIPKTTINAGVVRRPTELLTTPGLSSVGTSTAVHRNEADPTLGVTLNSLHAGLRPALTPNQIVNLQNQQSLLNNQIQTADQGYDSRIVNPNQQIVNITPKNEVLLSSDPRLVSNSGQVTTLENVQQQQILSSELSKTGIDASQLQLTNVPLSAVSGLPANHGPANLRGGVIDDRLTQGAWARYGRETIKSSNDQ